MRRRRKERPGRRLTVAGRGRHQPWLQARPGVHESRAEHQDRGRDQPGRLRRHRGCRGGGPDVHDGEGDESARQVPEFFEAGKIAAALCHGVAVLRYATLSNGDPLVKGRTVTGFTNIEEDFVDEAVWSAGELPRATHVIRGASRTK